MFDLTPFAKFNVSGPGSLAALQRIAANQVDKPVGTITDTSMPTPAGGGAFDSLRLEKGYRLWGRDIHAERNPCEAGVGFAVKMRKGEFIDRNALRRIRACGIPRKLSCMTLGTTQHLSLWAKNHSRRRQDARICNQRELQTLD